MEISCDTLIVGKDDVYEDGVKEVCLQNSIRDSMFYDFRLRETNPLFGPIRECHMGGDVKSITSHLLHTILISFPCGNP